MQPLTLAATPQGHLEAQAFVTYLRTQVVTPGPVFLHSESGNTHRNAVLGTSPYRLEANEVIQENIDENQLEHTSGTRVWPCFAHKGVYLVTCKLYSHGRVHLLFTVIVGKGGLDLSVAGLQAIHEWGHWCHGHRVMLDRIPHIRSVQVLPLMGYDLGGLLTVKYREICGHVDIHVVHGSLGQAAVGL